MRTTITVPNPTPVVEFDPFKPMVLPWTNNRNAVRGRKKATVPHETIAQAKTAVSLVVQQIVVPAVIEPPIKKIEPPSVLMPLHQLKRLIGFNVVAEIKKMYERDFIKSHLQNVEMSWDLVQEIFQKLKIGDGTILCMFNVEWVAYLVRVLKKDVNTIFFVDDGLDMNDGTGKISSIKAQLVVDMLGVPKENIIHHSKIEGNTMKFDYIVGNPPYAGQSSLHQKFFVRSFGMLKENGKIAFIQPATPYLNKNSSRASQADKEMKDILRKHVEFVNLIDGSVFEGASVAAKIAVTIASPSINSKSFKVRYEKNSIETACLDTVNQLMIPGHLYESISKKYEIMCKKFGNFQNVMKAPGKLKAYVARVRGNINGNDDFYTIVPNVDHRNRQNTNFTADMHDYGIPIENVAYLDNCYNYCETFFARFALALLKFSIDNDPSKMKYIPMVDFSRTYTEDELFDMAGFTDEEREIIMNTLPDYHNRRK